MDDNGIMVILLIPIARKELAYFTERSQMELAVITFILLFHFNTIIGHEGSDIIALNTISNKMQSGVQSVHYVKILKVKVK
jgi:hypothetical protein